MKLTLIHEIFKSAEDIEKIDKWISDAKYQFDDLNLVSAEIFVFEDDLELFLKIMNQYAKQ
jgi:hypothetical protein